MFEVWLAGTTGGAVLGSQHVARITIAKSDSPGGVVRFLNESLITVTNPNSTLKLRLVLERAGGGVGNATVRAAACPAGLGTLRISAQSGFALRQVAWIIRGPNSREALPASNTDIREPVNGSFFFSDGEEGPRSIELRVLPHGEVEVEETFVLELSVLSGEVDVDPQAGSVTLKVPHHTSSGDEHKGMKGHRLLIGFVFQIEKFGDPNGVVQFSESALREQVFNESRDDEGPFNISLPVIRREGVMGDITVRPEKLPLTGRPGSGVGVMALYFPSPSGALAD